MTYNADEDAEKDDWTPSQPVRQTPPKRREDELHERIRRAEQSHRRSCRPKRLGVKGLYRYHQAEPEQVQKDGDEGYEHGAPCRTFGHAEHPSLSRLRGFGYLSILGSLLKN